MTIEKIYSNNGITVHKNIYNDERGIEYQISDGFTTFTQSEEPILDNEFLNKLLHEYAYEKMLSESNGDENEIENYFLNEIL